MKKKLVKLYAILACIVFTLSVTACSLLLDELTSFTDAEPVVVENGEPVVSADQADKTVTVSDEKVLKAEINEYGQLVVTPLKWGTADVTFYDEENDADVNYQFKVTTKGEVNEISKKKVVRSYSINFEYYEGGTITASKTTAHAGETITLSVTTYDGYNFNGLTVKQGSNTITLTKNNTFTMPKGNVTISANFTAIDYNISFASMTNGSVTTDKTTVHVGDSIVLNVTPKDGYQLGTLSVTSGNQDVEVRNNVFIMPAGNVTVYATFVLKGYNINLSSSIENGTVTADKTSAHVGEEIILTATPAEGYQFERYNVTAGGQQITVVNNKFTMPKDDVTVSAIFTAIDYTVSFGSMTNGSVTADKTTAHVGDEITLNATPAEGYRLDSYTVTSGGQQIELNGNTFRMPAGNVTVTAAFTAVGYTVTINNTPHGSVTASKTSAHADEIITLTATPDNGYNLAGFTVTSGGQNIEVKDNSFKMPAGNVTVSATFTAGSYTISVDSNIEHGSVTADKTTAHFGDVITLTATPVDGYQFGVFTVTSGGQTVALSGNNTFTMPAGDVTVSATFTVIGYSITLPATITGGTVTASKTTANVGEEITLSANVNAGYNFGGYVVTSGTQQIELDGNKFRMPAGDVTVTATFTAIDYSITLPASITGGTVTASKSTAHVDDEITLTATPVDGYQFGVFTVTSGGQTVALSGNNTFTMPAGDVTVSATFTAIGYSITLPATITGGTVTASKTTANVGEEITLTAAPSAGYNFGAFTVTSGGQNVTLSANNTFTMPAGNVTVSATFTAIDYLVSVAATTNGSVTASKTSNAHVGDIITLTASPNDGYQFGAFTVTSNGQTITVTDNSFTMPAGNVTVSASFTAIGYTVSVATMTHGSVTASKTTANVGEEITLTATPNAGYTFEEYIVTSGGQSVTVSTTGTFTMPAGNVAISATFTAIDYTVSVAAITNGSVTTSKSTAHVDDEITLTATPVDGYQFGAFTVTSNGQTVTVSDNTFTMPAGDVTVSATFTAIGYSITLPATITGGTVTASKSTASVGEEITLTATPSAGYNFGAFTVTSGGQTVTLSGNDTFTMPAGDVTVTATFTAIDYSITLPTSITGGTVTASKSTASVGEEITLTATPSAGYNFGAFTVTSNGQTVTVSDNTFTMPAGNVTVSATFTAVGYTVGVATMTHGSVTASKTAANVGEEITLTATPNAGYTFEEYIVTSGGQSVTVSTTGTFTMPAGNVAISATFTPIDYSITLPASITGGTVTASKSTAHVDDEITLTATPVNGYQFGAFTVTSGGQTVTVSDNTFTMPAGNVTVSATFTAIGYSITLPATITGGTVTASKTTANVGEEITFTATPSAGYNFGAFTVTSGGQTVTLSGNETFTMPAGDVTVTATFTAIDYSITLPASITGGTVTASKSTAHVDDEITLTATPVDGYQFGAFTVTSGGQQITVTNNTFTMPAGNVTVSASFTAIGYTVSVATMTHGSVTASKTTANVGETITLTATPNAGYNFGEYTVTSGGQSVAVTNNTFTMPAGNVSISATFTAIDYTVAVATMTHGSVTASKTTANVGEEITLTATPSVGYNFGAYTVTSGGQTVTVTNNTFTMPAGNVTVSATFTAINYSITLPTSITGGTVTASKTSANVGETITLTATPAAGYNFGAYTVTSGGQSVTVTNNTFTMPAGNVTVSATFVERGNVVGDVLLNDGTIIYYENVNDMTNDLKAAAVGVLYALDENGTPRGWLGLYNSAEGTNSGTYKWKAENNRQFQNIICTPSDSGTGAASTATFTGDTDGSNNWAYICSQDSSGTSDAATNYPAFNYVNNYASTFNLTGSYATGWYMPSLAELCYIYRNKDVLNSVLSALGGTQLYSDAYWSSSQSGDYTCAWYVKFDSGYVGMTLKNSSKLVCCVRAF